MRRARACPLIVKNIGERYIGEAPRVLASPPLEGRGGEVFRERLLYSIFTILRTVVPSTQTVQRSPVETLESSAYRSFVDVFADPVEWEFHVSFGVAPEQQLDSASRACVLSRNSDSECLLVCIHCSPRGVRIQKGFVFGFVIFVFALGCIRVCIRLVFGFVFGFVLRFDVSFN